MKDNKRKRPSVPSSSSRLPRQSSANSPDGAEGAKNHWVTRYCQNTTRNETERNDKLTESERNKTVDMVIDDKIERPFPGGTPEGFWFTQVGTETFNANVKIASQPHVSKYKRVKRPGASDSEPLITVRMDENGKVCEKNIKSGDLQVSPQKMVVHKVVHDYFSERSSGAKNDDFGQYQAFGMGEILRASISQTDVGQGTECTAICVCVGAHAFLKPLNEWSCPYFTNVVTIGVYYYNTCPIPEDTLYLSLDEAVGIVTCENGTRVMTKKERFDDGVSRPSSFTGYFNALNTGDYANSDRLPEALTRFLQSEQDYAVFTASANSFGLFKQNGFLYFVDPHSRGPHGERPASGVGKACIIKYTLDNAPQLLSAHIHELCEPTGRIRRKMKEEEINKYFFELSPFSCKIVQADIEAAVKDKVEVKLHEKDEKISVKPLCVESSKTANQVENVFSQQSVTLQFSDVNLASQNSLSEGPSNNHSTKSEDKRDNLVISLPSSSKSGDITPDHFVVFRNGLYCCTLCTKKPYEKEKRKNTLEHVRIKHTEHLNYPCGVCRQKFFRPSERTQHFKEGQCMNQDDDGSKSVPSFSNNADITPDHFVKLLDGMHCCTLCPCKYEKYQSATQHIRFKHYDHLNYPCRICGKPFIKPGERKQHLKNDECNSGDQCNVPKASQILPQHEHNQILQLRLSENVNGQVGSGRKQGINDKPSTGQSDNSERNDIVPENFIVFKDEKYFCTECDRSYAADKYFSATSHVQKSHRELLRYYCKVCGEMFYKFKEREVHLGEHGRKFKCAYCDKKYALRKGIFYAHLDNDHPNQPRYFCTGCFEQFENVEERRTHEQQCTEVDVSATIKKHQCSICPEAFPDKFTLDRHVDRHLKKPGSFPCDECTMVCNTRDNLISHKYYKHSDELRYTCSLCGRGFKSYLKGRKHEEKKTCLHKLCKYEFPDKQAEENHKRLQHNPQTVNFLNMIKEQNIILKQLNKQPQEKQVTDFQKIYSLSKQISTYRNSRRKLYVMAFVPKNVTSLQEYLSDIRNVYYIYIGKSCVNVNSVHVSLHHFESNRKRTTVTALMQLSGYRCFHICDVWLHEHYSSCDMNVLAFTEALLILKVLLFSIHYKTEHVFFQKPELVPLITLPRHEIEKMRSDVIESKGNILCLKPIEYQFCKEYVLRNSVTSKAELHFCSRCKTGLFTRYIWIRHTAKCSPKRLQMLEASAETQLLSLESIDAERLEDIFVHYNVTKRYICYTVIGVSQSFTARNRLLEWTTDSKPYAIYHGQNCSGVVSDYHFASGSASTLKNLAKCGLQLYQVFQWECESEEEMYRLETYLVVRSYLENPSSENNIGLANKYIVMYNVCERFLENVWMETLFLWQQEADPFERLPSCFKNVKRKNVFVDITNRLKNNEAFENDCDDDSDVENISEINEDSDDGDD